MVITMARGKNKWDRKSDTLLRQTYSTTPIDILVSMLQKTRAEIYDRAVRLSLSRASTWDEEEVKFLLEHYPYKGIKFCAIKLNRSFGSVMQKASSLKIKAARISYKNPDTIQVIVSGEIIDSYPYTAADANCRIMHATALGKTKYKNQEMHVVLLRNFKLVKKIIINEIQKTNSTSML